MTENFLDLDHCRPRSNLVRASTAPPPLKTMVATLIPILVERFNETASRGVTPVVERRWSLVACLNVTLIVQVFPSQSGRHGVLVNYTVLVRDTLPSPLATAVHSHRRFLTHRPPQPKQGLLPAAPFPPPGGYDWLARGGV
jgi:hypothetical protein